MSELTYFWHDYETWGRDPAQDWPAQFAGVRTDADLNEIDGPVSLFCAPPRDRLPDPESCLITGLTPQACAAQGIPEAQFAARIEAELGRPGTVGVGYNTLRFDDHFTRYLLWRNLYDPYAREWQNGCSRWDLLDTVRCAFALRPEALNWPRHPDGRVSFKLEDLARANGLWHENAHEALSDVRATIALARKVKQQVPKLWDFCLRLRQKAEVKQELLLGRPVLHVSGQYPTSRGCLAVVFPFAPHPEKANEVIVWDLAEDPAVLMALTTSEIRTRVFTRQAELPEGVQRLPIKTIHINQSPVVVAQLKTLSTGRAQELGIDMDLAMRHAEAAARMSQDLLGVWREVFQSPPRASSVRSADADLYGGFLGDADRRRLGQVRALKPDEMSHWQGHFDDPRLDDLVFLYRARNWPEHLTEADRTRWLAHLSERFHSPGTDGSAGLESYLGRLEDMHEAALERGDERAESLLGDLVEWADELSAHLP